MITKAHTRRFLLVIHLIILLVNKTTMILVRIAMPTAPPTVAGKFGEWEAVLPAMLQWVAS